MNINDTKKITLAVVCTFFHTVSHTSDTKPDNPKKIPEIATHKITSVAQASESQFSWKNFAHFYWLDKQSKHNISTIKSLYGTNGCVVAHIFVTEEQQEEFFKEPGATCSEFCYSQEPSGSLKVRRCNTSSILHLEPIEKNLEQ